jgi:hypothetical protein
VNVGSPLSYGLKAIINLYLGKQAQEFSVVVKGKTVVDFLLRMEFVYFKEVMYQVLSVQSSPD